jgi:hypothetical protein
MSGCDKNVHDSNTPNFSEDSGHTAIEYKGRIHYVFNGHLYHEHEGKWKDSKIEDSIEHPVECLTDIANGCWAHPEGEICGPDCGHEAVPHGDQTVYLVPDGHGNFELHSPHGDHCHHHGKVKQHIPKP